MTNQTITIDLDAKYIDYQASLGVGYSIHIETLRTHLDNMTELYKQMQNYLYEIDVLVDRARHMGLIIWLTPHALTVLVDQYRYTMYKLISRLFEYLAVADVHSDEYKNMERLTDELCVIAERLFVVADYTELAQ